ncbi:MAG: hypothetical protein JXB47_15585 [Anaerolineae bacterium]|nr:hypothetical protein [Anaerolineae bacterium]
MTSVPIYNNRTHTSPQNRWVGFKLQRGFVFGVIMVAALGAFELFNFGTTEYALTDLLGRAEVLGVGWASVLAVAFCAIDFAGLARLFTPEQGADEPREVWYLMGAWFLGAAANAVMTWWAITLALLPRPLGNEILSREQLLTVVPIFVALLVWLTRILIIGTFGIAGERLFSLGSGKRASARAYDNRPRQLASPPVRTTSQAAARPAYRPPAKEKDEDELVYEPVNEVGAAYTPPVYGRTRPAPKPRSAPGASYGYAAAPSTDKHNGAPAWSAPGYYSGGGAGWLHRSHPEDGETKT